MDQKSIRCTSVTVSKTAISELDGERIIISIPREQIDHIKLFYGSGEERPLLSIVISLILCGLGIVWAYTALYLAEKGGRVTSIGYGVPLVLIGAWLLRTAIQKRYYFLVSTGNDHRKVSFEKSANVLEIRQFIDRVQQDFGYKIDSSVLVAEMHD